MTNFMKTIFATLLLVIFIAQLDAQSTYENGWTAFNANDLDEARADFKRATSDNASAADAFLSMSIVNTIDRNDASAFESFVQFYSLCKDPNPYLYAMWYDDNVLGSDRLLTKNRIKFFNELIKGGKLNATMLAKTQFAMASNLQAQGKFDKSDELFAQVGSIMTWQFAGNFENISGSGFDKSWDAITHPESDYEFINRNGVPIKWFDAVTYRPGRWMHPGYQAYTDNSIMFAQTFVKSATEQEIQVRLGVSGSVKVWINDKLMFSEEEERDNGIDSYIFTAKLNSGFNRVLIQLGQSVDVDDMNFNVRFTNDNGALVQGLEYRSDPRPYDKESGFESKVIPHFCETYFENKLKENPTDILSYILMADAYLSNDKSYESRKVLIKAQDLVPKSSYISNLLMDVYIREDANTLLSLELEKVKKNDEKNPLSLSLLFNEAIEEKDYEKAEGIISEIEDVYGKSEDVYSKRIEILVEKDEQQDMIDLMKVAYSAYPKNWEFVNYRYLIAIKVENNYAYGLGVLNKFLKNNYHASAMKQLASHYSNTGNVSKAISIYMKMHNNEPYLPGYLNTIASTYSNLGNYKVAMGYYEKLVENAPYVGYYMGELATVYKELDNPDAKEMFDRSLLYSPTDFDIRKTYREYSDKKPIFDYFETPDLYALYEKSESAEDYPEDNSLIIKYETQKVVYEGGGSEEKVYLLAKVFNVTGIDAWKEYNIGYGSADIEKAEVLKADGNKLKAETRGSYVVFTNLEENDAILLIYTVKFSNDGKLLKHFWDEVYFNIFYPYNSKKYSILAEGNTTFQYEVAHSDLKPTITKVDDEFTMYTWEKVDEPSIKSEKYMRSLSDFSEVLHVSTIPDWNWVNSWYYDISTTKAKSDFEVQDVTAKLLEGKESLSDREKIHLIYDYVVKNIRYSSIPFRQNGVVPQKASKVINTKIGDCKDVSTLFVAMCKEAGYKAEIVLVNTRDNGEQDLALPTIGFNHAIAKVYVDNTYYIVELTSDLNAFSTMGSSLKKAFVLEINNTNSTPYLLDAETRVLNAFTRTSEVNIDGDNLKIRREIIRYGDYASYTRNSYRDIGDKKREKKIQQAISDEYAHAKLNKLNFDSTLYTTDDSIFYFYEFEVTDAFTSFNKNKLIEIPLAVKQSPIDFISNTERKYDLALWRFNNDDYQMEVCTIHVPSNMWVVEMPKNKAYSCAYADYYLTFKKKGSDIIIERKLSFKKDVVPVADFQVFSDFYSNVIKADKTQIGFKNK